MSHNLKDFEFEVHFLFSNQLLPSKFNRQQGEKKTPKITVQRMCVTWITPDELGVSWMTQITLEYSGLPVRIAKWSSGLPELFPPRDYLDYSGHYCGLPEMFPPRDHRGLLRITFINFWLLTITPVYIALLRITSLDHQVVGGYSELFPPRDYRGLLWITVNYPGLCGLLRFTWINTDYQIGSPSVLRITRDDSPSGLPRITSDYFHLLLITNDYSRLLRITPDYQFGSPSGQLITRVVSPSGLPPITVDYARLLRIMWITMIYSHYCELPRITSSDHQVVPQITVD